jgi:hypothetical protein
MKIGDSAVIRGDLRQAIDDAASYQIGHAAGEVAGNAVANEIVSQFLGAVEKDLASQLGSLLSGNQTPVNQPQIFDSVPPRQTLKTDPSGTITTPGGYKISPAGQYGWNVTGPDGKLTKVWGDPHVNEQNGKTWNFQQDSTFVLGDGTRINVTTVPWGNAGAHVTSQLEVLNGHDRVMMTGVDSAQGGTTGKVLTDGFQHVNDFGGAPVFTEGASSDDWGYQGKEIEGGTLAPGSQLQLGKDLQPVAGQLQQYGGSLAWAEQMVQQLTSLTEMLIGLEMLQMSNQPYQNYGFQQPQAQSSQADQLQGLSQAFRDVGSMFNTLADWTSVSAAASRRVFA